MKKRYWLFAGDCYYPQGGMDDFKGDFDTISEAKNFYVSGYEKNLHDWGHILDTETSEIIPFTYENL